MNDLTEKKKRFALERLGEIGIELKEDENSYDFTIPHGLIEPRCVEFGFLLAQLTDCEFPDGFSSLSDLDSKIYEKKSKPSPVEFVESYPHGMKYRVYKKK